MLGTIVNTLAIIFASFLGLLLKGGIKEKYSNLVMSALGLSVFYVGASGAITGISDANSEPVLFIISLAIGSIIGEWIDIEAKLQQVGDFLQSKMNNTRSNISQGFVTASLIFCVGTMAILGSIDSGISGDHTTLYIKSILDGIMSLLLASTLGFGVMLSAISVFIYQGLITMFASTLQPFITADMLREIGIIGGILISGIGINILEIKKIKVGNMLPAILVPIIYYLIF